MIKFASLMALFLGFAAQAQTQTYTSVLYNQTVALPNCGGTIDTQCSDRYNDRCWINVHSSTCNQVRLYDTVTYDAAKGIRFNDSGKAKPANLIADGSGTYSTGDRQLYAKKTEFKLSAWKLFSFRQNKYYVTAFVSKDGKRPYDRVVLWFKNP